MTTDITKKQLSLTLPEEYADDRLDQALAKCLPEYSRTQIKEWIETGAALVNGQSSKAKTKVKGGELVTIEAVLKEQPKWEAQPIPLNIVHEDEAVIVINKPAGLVVHPGAGNASRTLLNALLHHAPELHALPRAGILHRLDKETSGLLLIAKTPAALRDLSEQLKERSLAREYQAIVYGAMISGGTVDAAMDRHPLQRKRMTVIESGKPAITHYRVAEKYRNHTRLHVKLETGRTHQIRLHMLHIHHPIVGDPVYGGRVKLSKNMSDEMIQTLRQFKRQALHAFALGFTHPVTGEWTRFECELPQDMQQLIQALQEDKRVNE
jgi:23S rRNA pseudouridine1911/1915/1917 synthase